MPSQTAPIFDERSLSRRCHGRCSCFDMTITMETKKPRKKIKKMRQRPGGGRRARNEAGCYKYSESVGK